MLTEHAFRQSLKTHPLLIGTAVAVLRLGMMTKPYVEGRALIQAPGDEPDQYWVAFPGDPVRRLRHVFPVCETPALPSALLNLWRAEPMIAIDEGFANDNAILGRAK